MYYTNMCLAYLLWLTPMHGSASSIITLLHVTTQNNGGTAPAYSKPQGCILVLLVHALPVACIASTMKKHWRGADSPLVSSCSVQIMQENKESY